MSQVVFQHCHVSQIQRTLISSIQIKESHDSVNFFCMDGTISCNQLVLVIGSGFWREIMMSNNSETIHILAPEYSVDQIKKILHTFVFGRNDERENCEKSSVEKIKPNIEKKDSKTTVTEKKSKRIVKFNVERKNTCPICLKVLSPGYLKEHVRNVHQDRTHDKHQCNKCPEKFLSREGLKANIESTHKNKNPYICITCKAVFTNKTSLRRHCKSEKHKFPKEVPVLEKYTRCKVCNKAIMKDSLDFHMELNHPTGNEYKCKECDFSTKRIDSLNRHRKLVHQMFDKNVDAIEKNWSEGTEYECPSCKKVLFTKEEISDHVVFETCKLTCKICKKVFTLKSNLDRHTKKFHKEA